MNTKTNHADPAAALTDRELAEAPLTNTQTNTAATTPRPRHTNHVAALGALTGTKLRGNQR